MTSLKDVAEACGVSVATVSKALRDQYDIGEETKEYIKRIADEMDYHPNSMARALKTRRTGNIGVLFVDEAQSGLTHDFFSRVLDGFKRGIEEEGFDLTFINASAEGREGMTLLQHCRYRGYDGVALACIDFEHPEVKELVQSELPVVTIDYAFDNCTVVRSDNAGGEEQLMQYLYDMGHRDIAVIHGKDSFVTRERLASIQATAKKLGMTIRPECIMLAAYRDVDATAVCTRKLLQMPKVPTCIMCPDDYSSLGARNVIQEMGMVVGKDISITGFDGIWLASRLHPALTTVKQNTSEIGLAAARNLTEQIMHADKMGAQNISIPTTLVKGETVAKV
ncbi:MAG: LacI family transcriptional regulator [Lachnospiraceae bacterium]|nr:LacI family transcriptional regulator [Lachnospiraceae bacterium]